MDKKRTQIILIGTLIGLAAGFAYWRFVGCQSGTCPIKSNWYMSTLFGGVFGYLISDSIKPNKGLRKSEETKEN